MLHTFSCNYIMEEPIVGSTEEHAASVRTEEPPACGAMEELSVGVATEEPRAKKLLVLDVNGLLVATYHKHQKMPGEKHHAKLGNFYVYERPGCEEFLNFCFKYFIVGVWSSAREHNVNSLVNHIFKDLKDRLSFSWHQRHCTTTAVMHPDNNKKPIFLKELSKLWAEVEPGTFDQSNTLLIDDSPYKALKNPPHTAIFPRCYNGDEVDDSFLSELRAYLEGLHSATNVQEYVSKNPIGEPRISSAHPLWSYFSSILNEDSQVAAEADGVTPVVAITAEVEEYAKQLNPEEIELEDMDQPSDRRDSSPVGVGAHFNRSREREDIDQRSERRDLSPSGVGVRPNRNRETVDVDQPHAKRNLSPVGVNAHFSRSREPEDMDQPPERRNLSHVRVGAHFNRIREPDNGPAEDSRRRRNAGNGHEYEDGRFRSRRNYEQSRERSRERSPRMHMNHLDDSRKLASNRRRDDPGFALHSSSSYHGEFNTRRYRDVKFGRSWHNYSRVQEAPPSRETFGRRNSEHDIGRALSSPGRRQFNTSFNFRDAPPPSVFSARDSGRGLLPPPGKSWENAERPTVYYDGFGERRSIANVSLTASAELDRSWERPPIPGRGRDYDRRWEEPLSSGHDRGYEPTWARPSSSGRGSEYDRRWEEPAIIGRGVQYDRRREEPMSSVRESDFDRRWNEPTSAGRDRGFDAGWDRSASSSQGKGNVSRWREPVVDVGGGREYNTRWEAPAHSEYRKYNGNERRWDQPGHARELDSKWSRAQTNQYVTPVPRVDYNSQGYRTSGNFKGRYTSTDRSTEGYRTSSDFKGRHTSVDRNIHASFRDDHRSHHWGDSNHYLR